jgi:GTPase
MKFVDQVRIDVKAGDGGNGCVAFRREKYIEKGGPSGGDGANGGSVIFTANPQLTTLLDYRYQQHHTAPSGEHGMGSDMNGRSGEDLVLQVPVGTLVRDNQTGELLADLSEAGQRVVVCKGGRGGLGNMNFATSTRQTPRFAQDGTPGEHRILQLELKLLADVGLLGFPNAGKSTLISRISRARPKVADYPFTTLVPNLGVVQYKDGLSFVVADIPGLIEGASEGVGLGLQFLRHVERCRVLIHLLDLSAVVEGRDALHDFDVLNEELAKYSEALSGRPQIVVANKLDLPYAREQLPKLQAALKKRRIEVLPMSGATGEGIGAVLDACARVLYAPPKKEAPLRTRVETNGAAVAKSKPPKASAGKSKAAQSSAAKSSAAKSSAAKSSAAKSSAAKSSAAKSKQAKSSAKKSKQAKKSSAMSPARKPAGSKRAPAKTRARRAEAQAPHPRSGGAGELAPPHLFARQQRAGAPLHSSARGARP